MRGLLVVGIAVGLLAYASGEVLAGTRTITVTGKVGEANATVRVNGVSATVDPSGNFSVEITLQEGSNAITVSATDAAGNVGQATVSVNLDTVAPVITITSPRDGQLFGAK